MARKAAKKAAKKATKKAVKKSTKKKAKKPKKAKKTKKRKAKRVSTIARGKRKRAAVFGKGPKTKTSGGLTKADLMKNKNGRIVSKKASAAGKKRYKNISGWTAAVAKARKALGCKGFVAIKKGSALYNKARGFYGKGSPKKA